MSKNLLSESRNNELESYQALQRLRPKIVAAMAVGTLGVACALCMWLISTSVIPQRRAEPPRLPDVAVVAIEPRSEEAAVIGYGTVRPKHQLDIIPQVSGQLTHVHENLAPGKVIAKGELLFEIASGAYEARVRQAEAEIRGLNAALARHDEERASLDERIATVEQMVAIEERDYNTSRKLYEQQSVGTQRDVDLVLQKYLRQKDVLTELKSRRDMIPHLRAETQAKLDAAQARLAQAKEDLRHTKIRCPFKARVETVGAYKSQVVTAFFSIARLIDMEAFEITVGVDPRELRWLDPSVRPASLTDGTTVDSPPVTVRWILHDQEYTWRGFVTRFERVDEVTRTARLAVEIRDVDMESTVTAGTVDEGPRLAIGMYCRTELPAVRLEDALLVPRHAIHDERYVYVFEADSEGSQVGRLVHREITPLRPIGEQVLVDYAGRRGTEVCELLPGDRVVVSPLTKPVDGMPIRLREGTVALSHPSPHSPALQFVLAAERGPFGSPVPSGPAASLGAR